MMNYRTTFVVLALVHLVLVSSSSGASYDPDDESYVAGSSQETDIPKSQQKGADDQLMAADHLLGLDNIINGLSSYYYQESCPEVERIIHTKVKKWMDKDSTIAASLIRLHFHDCSVRGCDASILLDHEGSERRANASKTLRGFEVIDDIKAEIEKKCPKTVSCADILTAAARDATVGVGGKFWAVPFGRKDGPVSMSREAESMVPMGREKLTHLIEFFQSKGLNILDLAVLLGMHSIGRSSCGALQHRLINFEGVTGKTDPSIDPHYLNFLRRKCRWASEYVDLDAETPDTLDAQYYKNLQNHMGLLSTDQMLYTDPRTAPLVDALASDPSLFYNQLPVSMARLGNIQDLLGDEDDQDDGEIRVNCNYVNPSY